MYLLGYDIGSSTVKVALVNAADQSTVAVVQYPPTDMDILSRQKGWAEQQPEIWWRNLCIGTQKLLSEHHIKAQEIKGIGLAYQMHGLVLVDSDWQVLRPAIIWCDSRAVSIGQEAYTEMGAAYCHQNLLNAPGNFTSSRLKWVKDNEPRIYQRIHRILLPGDYIAMQLTGNAQTTIPGLSEGIFWDFKEKKISQRVLDHFGFDRDILPEVSPVFSEMGKVSRRAAEQTGLHRGTPLTYRAGDQPNNAVSLNVLQKGEVAATSGTSGVVYGIVDRPLYDEQSRVNAFAHVNYANDLDRIGMLLCINGAGIQYSWMKHQIARVNSSYTDMERMVSSVPVGSEGICVLPFGNGAERIFHNRNLESHIYNLSFNRHTRAHLYRASLEGVAFTFVYGFQLLQEMGLEVDRIRVGNDNMFQSKTFSKTIATLLGTPIEVVETTGAIGAAQAAGVGSGIYQNLAEALSGVAVNQVYEPTLNYASCSQAYNYWLASLQRVLRQGGDRASTPPQLEKKHKQLQQSLQQKDKLLAAQAIQLESKNELLVELSASLKDLEGNLKNAEARRKYKAVQKALQALQEVEGSWPTLEEHYDLLNDDFIQRLRTQYPALSFEELKMCYFLKMKLSTKEIASRLHLSTRGVETKRYRLRKKFNLAKGANLLKIMDQL